jgi:hypothetical protein
VVRVEEDRRATVARRAAGHHGGLAELRAVLDSGATHLDELEHPGAAQELGDRLGALRDVGRVERGHDTDGIRTRRARSATVAGKPASTALRIASAVSVGAIADPVGGGWVMPVILRATDPRTPVAKNPTNTPAPEAGADNEASESTAKVGKGRPTPESCEQEAARKRPLVPNDRKEAAKQARAKQAEARDRARVGMAAGDDRYLPTRDRGPQKKYVRDYVDARFSIGEVLIPVMFLVILLTLIPDAQVQTIGILALWAFFLVACSTSSSSASS